MKFDIVFFPNIAVISYIFLLLSFIVIATIGIRCMFDRNRKNKLLWILCFTFFIIGIVTLSRVKYSVRDYIERDGYTLVIAIPHFTSVEYKKVNYHDYWKNMNSYTYELDSETKSIYMKMGKFW